MTKIDPTILDVLMAISNKSRLQILLLLDEKNFVGFSELAEKIGMKPKQDAGTFGYHLKTLKDKNLILGGAETGYELTKIGHAFVDFFRSLPNLISGPEQLFCLECKQEIQDNIDFLYCETCKAYFHIDCEQEHYKHWHKNIKFTKKNGKVEKKE